MHATIVLALIETKLRAKKSLGQHFLSDRNLCRKIASFAHLDGETTVVEVGPGTGQLTEALLAKAHLVIAIEFDSALIPYLENRFSTAVELEHRLRLVQADILCLDWDQIIGRTPVKVVGNLPYNIATRILLKMTEIKDRFQSCSFMLQREVADRILSKPGKKSYGYLTLLMQYHFRIMSGFEVSPEVFVPKPKVSSYVIQLIPHLPPYRVPDYHRFLYLLKTAFKHRRKTLWNNLRVGFDEQSILTVFQSCGIPPQARPEGLTLQQYACLSRVL